MADFLDIDDVRSFVREWNQKYPIDRWRRDKYNVAFGSKQHLDHSLLDMRIAFEDEHFHRRLDVEDASQEEAREEYQHGRGDWLNKQPKFTKMTANDVDDAFNRLASNLDSLKDIAQKRGENGKVTIKI